MGLIAAGATDIGRKRKSNQDAYFLSLENKLFVVADGMGGHNGGDIASQMAVKALPEYLIKNISMEPTPLLTGSIKESNRAIKNFGETHPELVGMGTTIVSFYFRGQNIYVGNVGDSRGYLVNNKKIFQLTRDHSLVQEKLNYGVYNREQAALDPQKNVLVRTVGFEDDVDVDVFIYKVVKNDIFLCCSDGLHGKVSDEDILYIINKHIPDPAVATQATCEQVVKSLIAQANENGGQDNITAILVIAQ
ncbi:Stp1/IreP family PP2C-type Ser/Thr phosphatase [Bacteriovorax stolpii]|uniref:Serine/threonine-protein phosphatase n=1 Tax=Bacteriovorax stolpii TaxID=960 RepID=A0A2K9NRL6_BACTC|nr:Stp1/IreP family PP2C-type Ser/Thr phosphatase [Bacteriovorax stolpii]AUN98170.1 serine/threonine-protein phosphatase [Bacteriovorax stolpii]QDK41849.1 Stp1/IreP family PP2C-type Ser/Thr phosphatase [Bacteriovorax stolpii]TDP52087.1 protein phosphatase [Bacteriovorax stolpii]